MLYYFDHFMQLWLLPPGFNLLLAVVGLLLGRFWLRIGKCLIALSLISLWFLSMPVVAQFLVDKLQYQYPALSITSKDISASAIVILDAGVNPISPEFGCRTVSNPTLMRLRYGAFLHKQTGIPILVSGSYPIEPSVNEAEYMSTALKEYFNVETRWKEDRGVSTKQEAKYSTEMLKKAGVTKIYLVTHALHMPRSMYAFQHEGLIIIPAPTGYLNAAFHLGKFSNVLPSLDALHISAQALHEYIGLCWYYLIENGRS